MFRLHPCGFYVFGDIKNCIPGYSFDFVLDVGANVGQSKIAIADRFPLTLITALNP